MSIMHLIEVEWGYNIKSYGFNFFLVWLTRVSIYTEYSSQTPSCLFLCQGRTCEAHRPVGNGFGDGSSHSHSQGGGLHPDAVGATAWHSQGCPMSGVSPMVVHINFGQLVWWTCWSGSLRLPTDDEYTGIKYNNRHGDYTIDNKHCYVFFNFQTY